jgi:hypothetical protein
VERVLIIAVVSFDETAPGRDVASKETDISNW